MKYGLSLLLMKTAVVIFELIFRLFDRDSATNPGLRELKTLRIIRGLDFHEGDSLKAQQRYSRLSAGLQIREWALFSAALTLPKTFVRFVLGWCAARNRLEKPASGIHNRTLWLLHHFFGSKQNAITLAWLSAARDGIPAVILADRSALTFTRHLLHKLRLHTKCLDSNSRLQIPLTIFNPILGSGMQTTGSLILVDYTNGPSLYQHLRRLKETPHHLVIIPDSESRHRKNTPVPFLGASLLLVDSVRKISRDYPLIMTVLPGCNNLLLPVEFTAQPCPGQGEKALQNSFKCAEKQAFVYPEYYYPFACHQMWQGLYPDTRDRDLRVISRKNWKQKPLYLMSDGRLYRGLPGQIGSYCKQ